MPAESLDFEVRRDAHDQTRVVTGSAPAPRDGEVLVEVERFGLSANNITYATLGTQLRYWDLFPAGDGWGRVPAWAYLRVVESAAPGVEVGRRIYGLAPMSTHLVMRPDRLHGGGFTDAARHRAHLSPVYNAYSWLDADPAHVSELEDHLLVLRPVFWLSYLIDDHLAHLDGATSSAPVLVTSASSRVAMGLAGLLAQRGQPAAGLTSLSRVPYVESLRLYSSVHPYSGIGSLSPM